MKIIKSFAVLCASVSMCVFSTYAAAQARDLPEVAKSGKLKVALYKEFQPFSDDNAGIDVDLARLLASKLGVSVDFLWFDADESMEDDMRNMVWRGTVLGYGPADVMLHVPVDKDYMAKNTNVMFFAPYYREKFAIARNVAQLDKLENMGVFRNHKVGVESESYPDTVLLSADAGAYRSNVVHFKTTTEAIAALKQGSVSAVMAMQSELEAGLTGTSGFEVSDVPLPVINRRQWVLGMAVKAGHEALAKALQAAMNDLMASGEVAKVFQRHGVNHRSP